MSVSIFRTTLGYVQESARSQRYVTQTATPAVTECQHLHRTPRTPAHGKHSVTNHPASHVIKPTSACTCKCKSADLRSFFAQNNLVGNKTTRADLEKDRPLDQDDLSFTHCTTSNESVHGRRKVCGAIGQCRRYKS